MKTTILTGSILALVLAGVSHAQTPNRTLPAPQTLPPASAQTAPRPPAPAQAPNLSPNQIPPSQVASPPGKSLIRRNPLFAAALPTPVDLPGWTPVTQGQSRSGPAVVQFPNGAIWLMTRAQDGELYVGQVPMPLSGSVPNDSWRTTGLRPRSETECRIVSQPREPNKQLMCVFAGEGGAGDVTLIDVESFKTRHVSLPGVNVTTRPAIFGDVVFLPGQLNMQVWVDAYRTELRIWDGRNGVINGRIQFSHAPAGDVPDINYRPPGVLETWTPGPKVTGAFSCTDGASAACASLASDRITVVTGADLATVQASTPPLPGGLTTNLAPAVTRTQSGRLVVVARNNAGRLFMTHLSGGKFGPWRDVGGGVKNTSSISCITRNEAVTCFVHGNDGRIYAKDLGNTGGL